MKDDARQLLDDILCRWHIWSRSYQPIADVGTTPMFKGARAGRQWDTMDEVIEREIDGGTMAAVEFHIYELPPIQRTALQINARNLATGRSVWKSERLPQDAEERAVLLLESRNALAIRLIDAGIL